MENAERNIDKNLIKVVQITKDVNVKLNSKKIKLRSTTVEFMPHVIGKGGLTPDQHKVKAFKICRSQQKSKKRLPYLDLLITFPSLCPNFLQLYSR